MKINTKKKCHKLNTKHTIENSCETINEIFGKKNFPLVILLYNSRKWFDRFQKKNGQHLATTAQTRKTKHFLHIGIGSSIAACMRIKRQQTTTVNYVKMTNELLHNMWNWMKNKQTKKWPALTIGNYNSFDDNYRFFERLIRIYNENIKHNIDCGALHNERIEILLEKKQFSSSKSNSFNFMGCSMSIWPNLWSIAVDYFNGMEFLSFYNACMVFIH